MSRILFIARPADRIDHGFRFVDGFLVFAGRFRIGHDSGAGLEVSAPVLQHDGPQRNAAIERAVESEIADGSGVATALLVFQFANDLHRSNLRRPRNSSRWKS